jgi:uncharacterized protein YjbI with pentapeptide repeats
MTRDEAVKLLRGGPKGIARWNHQKRRQPPARLDLRGVNLTDAWLEGVDMSAVERSDRTKADVPDLSGAILVRANLARANLFEAAMAGADLTGAHLNRANLEGADLSRAMLTGAVLIGSRFTRAELHGASFAGAWCGGTVFDCDLSRVVGLNDIVHLGPSPLDVLTILRFRDDLPEPFLRGCGISEREVDYFKTVPGQPIRFYTCFISYSTRDEAFAARLHNDFRAAGMRCWKWDHDARTDHTLWSEIDVIIRTYDKFLLIASQHSLKSPAVIREIERAILQEDDRQKRRQSGEKNVDPNVLLAVRLDNYIFKWDHELKPDVCRKVIADARNWDKDNAIYQQVLQKLLRDLKPRPV